MKILIFILGLVLFAASVGFSGCSGKSIKTSGESSAAVSSSELIDGRWTGETEIPNIGTVRLGYDFKAKGKKLEGTTDGQYGTVKITNGVIEGNMLAFDVTINVNGQPILVNYTGMVAGNKLKLKWRGQGNVKKEVICTRQ